MSEFTVKSPNGTVLGENLSREDATRLADDWSEYYASKGYGYRATVAESGPGVRVVIHCENPGSCIEPGGHELAYEPIKFDCWNCKAKVSGHFEERVEGGSINSYRVGTCDTCGEAQEQWA